MNKLEIGTIVIVSVSVILASMYAYGQLETNERLFVKTNSFTALDDIRYTDNSELSYDIVNPPEEKIVIHNWNSLSASNQQLIVERLNATGYEDKGLIMENSSDR